MIQNICHSFHLWFTILGIRFQFFTFWMKTIQNIYIFFLIMASILGINILDKLKSCFITVLIMFSLFSQQVVQWLFSALPLLQSTQEVQIIIPAWFFIMQICPYIFRWECGSKCGPQVTLTSQDIITSRLQPPKHYLNWSVKFKNMLIEREVRKTTEVRKTMTFFYVQNHG